MVTAVASALYSFWFLTLPRKAWVYVMQTVKKNLNISALDTHVALKLHRSGPYTVRAFHLSSFPVRVPVLQKVRLGLLMSYMSHLTYFSAFSVLTAKYISGDIN